MANVEIPYNTDTEFAQKSNEICFGHEGEVLRVHTEPESHLNNHCVKSTELLDIPTQCNKQRNKLKDLDQ